MTESPRSLIVTSKSHGELALAVSLLRDTKFSGGAQLVLPSALYELNRDTLPVPATSYGSSADIIRAVETHRPDLVFLFSGYLFTVDKLMSASEFRALLEYLRSTGCRIITSDPFLGLATHLGLRDFDPRMFVPGEGAWKRRLVNVVRLVAGSRVKILNVPSMDDAIHLYPTGIPDVDDAVSRASFFNPAIRRSTSSEDDRGSGAGSNSSDRWVFAMSETDLHAQLVTMDLRDLIENLLGMLRFAVAEGRRPTLIAPALINEALSTGVPEGVELLHWLPVVEFGRRIMEAEHVFFWGAFSYSRLARFVNDRPFFSFDRGYLFRAAQSLYEAAVDCHLNGVEPTYLDQRQLFSPYVLAHLAKTQRPAMQAMREAWQRSPTPDALIAQLLD